MTEKRDKNIKTPVKKAKNKKSKQRQRSKDEELIRKQNDDMTVINTLLM